MIVKILILEQFIGIIEEVIIVKGFSQMLILDMFLVTIMICNVTSMNTLTFFAFSMLIIMSVCMFPIFIRLFDAFTPPFCGVHANIFNC